MITPLKRHTETPEKRHTALTDSGSESDTAIRSGQRHDPLGDRKSHQRVTKNTRKHRTLILRSSTLAEIRPPLNQQSRQACLKRLAAVVIVCVIPSAPPNQRLLPGFTT